MFSRGMFCAFASATIVRSRGFMLTSPPPLRAATVNSLMMRVKILPRLASAAPFLCLIVCHLEWPDIAETPTNSGERTPDFITGAASGRWPHLRCGSPPVSGPGLRTIGADRLLREDHPDVGPRVPRPAAVVAEQGRDLEACLLEPSPHLRHGQRAKRQREPMGTPARPAPLGEFLIEDRQVSRRILSNAFDERDVRPADGAPPAGQADALAVLLPRRQVGDQLQPECAAWLE